MSSFQVKTERIDPQLLNAIAKKKVNGRNGWKWFSWKCIGKTRDLLVKGGLPRIIASGPRKGGDNWRGVPADECVVTEGELDAAIKTYQSETGNCYQCFGSGQSFSRWHHIKGISFRACTACNATGDALQKKVAR